MESVESLRERISALESNVAYEQASASAAREYAEKRATDAEREAERWKRKWLMLKQEDIKLCNRITRTRAELEIAIKLYAKARNISIDEATDNVRDARLNREER